MRLDFCLLLLPRPLLLCDYRLGRRCGRRCGFGFELGNSVAERADFALRLFVGHDGGCGRFVLVCATFVLSGLLPVFVAYLGSFLTARGEHGVDGCALETQGSRNTARDPIDGTQESLLNDPYQLIPAPDTPVYSL